MRCIVGAVGPDDRLRARIESTFTTHFGPPVFRFSDARAYLAVHSDEQSPVMSATTTDANVMLCDGPYVPSDPNFEESTENAFRGDAPSMGPCNVVSWNRGSQVLEIRNDITGLLPMHYAMSADTLAFATKLFPLAFALDARPDRLGELQQIALQSCIGARTQFRDILLLRPAQRMRMSPGSGLDLQERPATYTRLSTAHELEIAELVWHSLISSAAMVKPAHGTPVGLFLSGGLDSRLVAAAFHQAQVPMLTVTHGQAGMSEVALAERVAQGTDAAHRLIDIDTVSYVGSPECLRRICFETGTALYPVWRLGGQHFRRMGARAVSSGFALDATLGGHFHDVSDPKSRLKRRLRFAAIGPHPADLSSIASDAYVNAFITNFKVKARRGLGSRQQLLDPEYSSSLTALLPQLDNEIDQEFERIRSSGTHPSKVIDRFMFENRGRRSALSQELIAGLYVPMFLPSADPHLMRIMSEIPTHLMMDHHLYYRLLRTFTPGLARIPGSNSPLPLNSSAIALELSRAARNRVDDRLNRLRLRWSGSRLFHSRSGAMDFETAARSGAAATLAEAVTKSPGSEGRIDAAGVSRYLHQIESWQTRAYNLTQLSALVSLTLDSSSIPPASVLDEG